MLNIDLNNLNNLEQKIHHTIMQSSKDIKHLPITKAAELCGCTISKVSKFVQKLGFNNYKQYMNYVYGQDTPIDPRSGELERIRDILDRFDFSLLDKMIDLINSHEKIILFGYGPSYYCMQYFEYKLRYITNKLVFAVQEEQSAEAIMDENSLLIAFSVTGEFKSFSRIFAFAKNKNCEAVLVLEEYNTALLNEYNNIFFLTKSFQPLDLLPHEKSRTVFFIFIEEILQRFIIVNRQKNRDLSQTEEKDN
ncbi:hypothetical protein BVG16_23825 [Paenibacillus selenitireducens]|uniref:HTH rpiR-type domain-containing protein n=2 Tax=Paenibacillus selenitireducens TaxID=1324314 RepID=A0A1T2X4Q2_9BACL|nr:hypothetical protein BVG16_23825 [Paenibacillus selenitireducens]